MLAGRLPKAQSGTSVRQKLQMYLLELAHAAQRTAITRVTHTTWPGAARNMSVAYDCRRIPPPSQLAGCNQAADGSAVLHANLASPDCPGLAFGNSRLQRLARREDRRKTGFRLARNLKQGLVLVERAGHVCEPPGDDYPISLFFVGKKSQVSSLSVYRAFGFPLLTLFIPVYASISRSILNTQAYFILAIHGIGDDAQIGSAIIESVAIPMIDYIRWAQRPANHALCDLTMQTNRSKAP